MPEVTVIMPTYNERESYLIEAIESIRIQSHQDFEFLIIVDNPGHPCMELLREYEKSR